MKANRKNGKILLVDDTPSAVGLVRTALENEGYVIFVATSGEKAINRAELTVPDLILLDIMMPGMDGFETCTRLKALDKTRDIPVIFMSARTDTFDKVKGFNLGAVDYITKPIDTEELLSRVKTHLTIACLQRELKQINAELEERVSARTEELHMSNLQLKEEISERKRAEEKIRAQSKFLQTSIDALTHPFYTINVKDYSISLFNKAAGINISEKTSTCYALTHGRSEPCQKDDHPCPIEEIKQTGLPTTVEHIHLDKNGNKRNIEIHAFPIFDKEGNLSQIIEYSIDITERKKAEAELRKHREQLEDLVKERTNELEATQEELVKHEKLSVLGQLTATVSHELRNPLGVIRSSTFYVESKLSDVDEKITKHLKRIDEQVDLCDSIIGDLFEYTRGRRSEMLEGELNPFLEEVLAGMTFPEPVHMLREMAPDLPKVRFDREKLQRVVNNLVTNAIQAVVVRQEGWKEEEGPYQPQVKVSTSTVENGVSIEVEDNGAGMDEETAARVFEPLFTTKARGSGLGLAIVKKIVEEHSGAVSIGSDPERGTKVTVVIPLQA
jgi:signal transduction histidine kinase/DNA-binding response OmpR family regulator